MPYERYKKTIRDGLPTWPQSWLSLWETHMLAFSWSRCPINRCKLFVIQFPCECIDILQRVLCATRTRNRNYMFISTQKPVQDDLIDTFSALVCNCNERLLESPLWLQLPTCHG